MCVCVCVCVCVYIYIYMHECVFCHFSCVLLFMTLWTVAGQPPLSVGLPRQEYWSGLPFPLPMVYMCVCVCVCVCISIYTHTYQLFTMYICTH